MAKRKIKNKEATGPQDIFIGGGSSVFGYLPYPTTKRTESWHIKVRQMMIEPTIAMLQQKYISAIAAPGCSIEAEEDVEENVVEFARQQMMKAWPFVARRAAWGCLNWGHQGFEVVYEVDGDAQVVIKKLKPLIHSMTAIDVFMDTGEFAGLSQSTTTLDRNRGECMLVSWNVEGTNWAGRPPMLNLEKAYDQKQKIETRAEEFDGRVAAAHWAVYYPPGRNPIEYDETTNQATKWEDNQEVAKKVLAALLSSGSAILPSEVEATLNELNEGTTGKSEWRIDLMVAAQSGGSSPYSDRLRYKDVEFARGLGFPERSVFEGEHGTKAEAGEHAEGAVAGIKDRADSVAESMTELLGHLLAWNFGEEYRGWVRVVANPMTDSHKAYLTRLYEALLSNSEISMTEYDLIDMDSMATQLGIPRDKLGAEEDVREIDDLLDGLALSGCGANSKGGKGFVKGNTCAVGSHGRQKDKPTVKSKNKEKVQRAKSSHMLVGKSVQREADAKERALAAQLKGLSFENSEPVDIVIGKKGSVQHGIEHKYMTMSKNMKITMNKYAQVRKVEWERKNNAPIHTVVEFPDGSFAYRRGVGSFRTGTMQPVKSVSELRKLINTPDEKLPESAKRTDDKLRTGTWVPATDGRGYKNSKTGEVVRPKK